MTDNEREAYEEYLNSLTPEQFKEYYEDIEANYYIDYDTETLSIF